MPSSEGGVPSNPPQRRYSTRRPPISRPPEPSVRRVPPKKARTLGPGETSSQAPANSHAPEDIQRPSGIALEVIIKRPMVTTPLIPGNLDCIAKPFHSELYFNMEAMQQQSDLRDSFGLLQRYHLERLMTPREFFYPKIAMDFYQSMTTQGVQSSIAIRFSIDRCQGILEARHIAKALHIPFQLEDPKQFRQWTSTSQRNMVRILSRGTSGDTCLLHKEFPSEMLLVNVLLRSNIFPLQHSV